MVVNELRGEKVDIVPYSDDPSEFVMKALAPATVREVRIHPDTGTAEVIVPDFQLSLAIGKEGQNARLAARLTGWRVDIKSETQLAEEEAGGGVEYAEGEWVDQRRRRARVAAGRGRRGDLGRRGRVRGAGADTGGARPRRRAGRGAPPSAAAPRPRRRRGREPTPRPRADEHAGRAAGDDVAEAPRGGDAAGSDGGGRRLAARAARPVRTCVGCRRVAAVEELVRIRAHPRSGLALGAGPGRGAWLCRSHPAACLDEAQRRRAVERALRTPVRDDDIEQLARDWTLAISGRTANTGAACK